MYRSSWVRLGIFLSFVLFFLFTIFMLCFFSEPQDCCKQVLARQGVRGFYAGLVANVARALPETSLQFLIYESLKNAIVVV